MISVTAPQIVRIGADAARQAPDVLSLLGVSRPLLVVDRHFEGSAVVAVLADMLASSGVSAAYFYGVVPDPTTASVAEALKLVVDHRADCIVALGGGSAIDTAKATALLAVHDVKLAALRAPYRVTQRGLPLIAIPTTAGTGSEATRFCLITDSDTGEKMVCIGEGFMAAAALIDYKLTLSAPRRVTADTGIDAFTHALEAYVGKKANAVSDLYAERALALTARALPVLMEDLADEQARADMALGSFLAGSAFSSSGLALAHGMSAPLGAVFHIPHGLSIGMLLPAVTRFSIQRTPEPYARVARLLRIDASADDARAAAAFMAWLDALVAKLALPSLSQYGVDAGAYEEAIDAMAQETPRSGAAGNNPAAATHADIAGLFRTIWS